MGYNLTCKNCDISSYSGIGSFNCISCPPGSYINSNQDGCLSCPPGKIRFFILKGNFHFK
jgi:hypothetical protein